MKSGERRTRCGDCCWAFSTRRVHRSLGDNHSMDLSQTMIFLTSNLGSEEVGKKPVSERRHGLWFCSRRRTDGRQAGPQGGTDGAGSGEEECVKRDHRSLGRSRRVPSAASQAGSSRFWKLSWEWCSSECSTRAEGDSCFTSRHQTREFVLQEVTDIKYGARHLKQAIEKFIEYPLANLSHQTGTRFGDMLRHQYKQKVQHSLRSKRKDEGAVVPNTSPSRCADSTAARWRRQRQKGGWKLPHK